MKYLGDYSISTLFLKLQTFYSGAGGDLGYFLNEAFKTVGHHDLPTKKILLQGSQELPLIRFLRH